MAAAGGNQASASVFDGLFASPTIEGMLALSWQDFQGFVQYVFDNAGYTVQFVANVPFPVGPGVDLTLYAKGGKGQPVAHVEVKRYDPQHLLNFADVAHVLGVLNLNHNTPGFLVTTSDFNGPATLAAAQAGNKLHLVNGEHFIRYIRYINGSRVDGSFAGIPTAPVRPISPVELEKADDIALETDRAKVNRPRILTIANPKGGVAKTTSALNIGIALAQLPHSQRVLLVDMDGQGSLTHALPRKPPDGAPPTSPAMPDSISLSDYFKGKSSLPTAVRETRFGGVSLVPAHTDLYKFQFSGAERTQAELSFVHDIRLDWAAKSPSSASAFDWVILDTPASDTFWGRAALAAADHILVPFYAEEFATQGLLACFTSISTMTALMGEQQRWQNRVLGILTTRWRSTVVSRDALNKATLYAKSRDIRQFHTPIPHDDKVETAHQGTAKGGVRALFGLGVRPSPAAEAYVEVVKELLNHANGN